MNSLVSSQQPNLECVESMIHVWERIPWETLPPSAKVDLGLWIFRFKPSIRIIPLIGDLKDTHDTFKALFPNVGLTIHKDSLYMSLDKTLCLLVKTLDWLSSPHGEKLGTLLGYPPCCSKHISQFPEAMIDSISALQNKAISGFRPHILDTSEYSEGICLVSHVPCSIYCSASSILARTFLKKVCSTKGGSQFQSWKTSMLKKYGDLLE